MIGQQSLLVTLVELVDRLPVPPPPPERGPGRPRVYTERLFLKALLIMIVRHLRTVTELLSVLAQPTPEMQLLRVLLTEQNKFPSRRTFERRLKALPDTLPAQSGCLGRGLEEGYLVLVSGRAGVGKSRLALECCERFKEAHPGYEVRCVFNRGPDLFDDLRVHFSEPGHYLILVDDANRVSRFEYVVQLLQDQRKDQQIKVVATVRD